MIEVLGKAAFDNNVFIKHLWAALRGIFFLPLPALEPFIKYFKETITPQLDSELGSKLLTFIDEYLVPNYFDPVKAKFHYSLWNYYARVLHSGENTTSTNCIESINRKLKNKAGAGRLTFHSACNVIKNFKSEFCRDYEFRVSEGNFLSQRNSVNERAQNIVQTVYNFEDLDFLTLSKTSTIITYCYKFAFADPNFTFSEFPPILTRTRAKLTVL